MLENPGRKMDYWLPQQGRHRPTLWLTHHCTYKYTGSGSVAQGETFEQINQIIKSNTESFWFKYIEYQLVHITI